MRLLLLPLLLWLSSGVDTPTIGKDQIKIKNHEFFDCSEADERFQKSWTNDFEVLGVVNGDLIVKESVLAYTVSYHYFYKMIFHVYDLKTNKKKTSETIWKQGKQGDEGKAVKLISNPEKLADKLPRTIIFKDKIYVYSAFGEENASNARNVGAQIESYSWDGTVFNKERTTIYAEKDLFWTYPELKIASDSCCMYLTSRKIMDKASDYKEPYKDGVLILDESGAISEFIPFEDTEEIKTQELFLVNGVIYQFAFEEKKKQPAHMIVCQYEKDGSKNKVDINSVQLLIKKKWEADINKIIVNKPISLDNGYYFQMAFICVQCPNRVSYYYVFIPKDKTKFRELEVNDLKLTKTIESFNSELTSFEMDYLSARYKVDYENTGERFIDRYIKQAQVREQTSYFSCLFVKDNYSSAIFYGNPSMVMTVLNQTPYTYRIERAVNVYKLRDVLSTGDNEISLAYNYGVHEYDLYQYRLHEPLIIDQDDQYLYMLSNFSSLGDQDEDEPEKIKLNFQESQILHLVRLNLKTGEILRQVLNEKELEDETSVQAYHISPGKALIKGRKVYCIYQTDNQFALSTISF